MCHSRVVRRTLWECRRQVTLVLLQRRIAVFRVCVGVLSRHCLSAHCRPRRCDRGSPQGGPQRAPNGQKQVPRGPHSPQTIGNGSTKSAVNLCKTAVNLFVHGVSHKFPEFGPFFAPLFLAAREAALRDPQLACHGSPEGPKAFKRWGMDQLRAR